MPGTDRVGPHRAGQKHPPRRLALLAEVGADNVTDGMTDETDGHIWMVSATPPFDPPRKVTARILEPERAGWVEQGPDGVFWRLTDTGRAVLEAAP